MSNKTKETLMERSFITKRTFREKPRVPLRWNSSFHYLIPYIGAELSHRMAEKLTL